MVPVIEPFISRLVQLGQFTAWPAQLSPINHHTRRTGDSDVITCLVHHKYQPTKDETKVKGNVV